MTEKRKYYGADTIKLIDNWFWVGSKTNHHLIKAYLFIKQAYIQAHSKTNTMNAKTAQSINQACEEMRKKENQEQFIAESLQAVSGITLNTNINEVLANRAEEILGGKIGEYKIVQADLISLNQDPSTLFLLATKIAVLSALTEIEPEILNLERLLRRDVLSLAKVLKVTATPNIQSTTGQWGKRLDLFTTELEIAIRRIKESESNLLSGKNSASESHSTHTNGSQGEIAKIMLQNLENLTGFKFKEEDLQTADGQAEFIVSDLSLVSSALKDLAIVLGKVAGIIKMAHTPPQAEMSDPESNKLNVPNEEQLLADSLHMAAYQVLANNFSFGFLAQYEQMDSILLMPLLSHNLLSTIDLLRTIIIGFQRKGLL